MGGGLRFGLFCVALLSAMQAQADVHGPAAVLPTGQATLTSVSRLQLQKLRLWLFLRADLGLAQGLELGVRWGMPTGGNPYVGAQAKVRLLEGARGALSAGGGAHYYERPALEAFLRAQANLRPLWLWAGLEANVELLETANRVPLWLYAGLSVPVSPTAEFVAEYDLYRAGFPRAGLNLGLRFWF